MLLTKSENKLTNRWWWILTHQVQAIQPKENTFIGKTQVGDGHSRNNKCELWYGLPILLHLLFLSTHLKELESSLRWNYLWQPCWYSHLACFGIKNNIGTLSRIKSTKWFYKQYDENYCCWKSAQGKTITHRKTTGWAHCHNDLPHWSITNIFEWWRLKNCIIWLSLCNI